MESRDSFKSRLGFILVSAGCAIGIGNVWKFPYICGINGGAAFVLIYLVFLAILGFPIVCAEFTVGRGSGKGAARAYEVLEKKGSKWHYFKWVSVVGSYILMAFYTMDALLCIQGSKRCAYKCQLRADNRGVWQYVR